MGKLAIICLGNRFVAGDDIGWRVHEHLTQAPITPEVDIVDGGLMGLDLLRLMEGRQRVVFADAVADLAGLANTDGIAVLRQDEVARYAVNYGHSAGLPYLLHMLPLTYPPPWPEIALVGAAGDADEATVGTLAKRCLEIAIHGLP